jgi:hypothetical protein
MIDNRSLVYWQQHAPWPDPAQIEQDLIISRALVDIFSHPLLKKELAFRGGTALQKCFYEILRHAILKTSTAYKLRQVLSALYLMHFEKNWSHGLVNQE